MLVVCAFTRSCVCLCALCLVLNLGLGVVVTVAVCTKCEFVVWLRVLYVLFD